MRLLSKVIKGARVWDKNYQLVLRDEFPAQSARKRNEAGNKNADVIAGARREAEEIVAKAKEEAGRIIAGAYEKGSLEGRKDALASANEEIEAMRAAARDMLKRTEEILQEKVRMLESDLINLAVEMAGKIVSMQISLDQETIVSVAREALQLIYDREQVIFFVNPAEADILRGKKEEFLQLLPRRAVVEIVPDASIKPGGLRIETEQGLVDATTDQRWSRLLEAIKIELPG